MLLHYRIDLKIVYSLFFADFSVLPDNRDMSQPHIITLTEHVTYRIQSELPAEVGQTLWQHYHNQVAVQAPSFKNGYQWELTNQGYAGYIPLTPTHHFRLMPKISSVNLFGMLEYAFDLRSFHFLKGVMDCETLEQFYEQLALKLAEGILKRAKQGLYQAYVTHHEQLPYLRGRLDIQQRPGRVSLSCHYEEQTVDNQENQILAWTLYSIVMTGLCNPQKLPVIRHAYQLLHRVITLTPCTANDCIGRPYHRLNEDYRALHLLCRFFLEPCGPAHATGDYQMLPFLVDMAKLYERFVARWLQENLPANWMIKTQERVMSRHGSLYFNIDLVLYDKTTGQPQAVLDTKYKVPTKPSTDDTTKTVQYATMKQCREAILIYPTPLDQPLEDWLANVRIRSLTFALDGDLDVAGKGFLAELNFS